MPNHNPKDVQLLALDVDGILTDGSIWITSGGAELKRFHVRDGLAMKMWMKLGYHLAIVSGRFSDAVAYRMHELGVREVHQGIRDKSKTLDELMERYGLGPNQIAFMGDDWPDLPAMKRVGYPITVSDAERAVKQLAALVTTRPGGQGAVREAIDHLLLAKGKSEAEQIEAESGGEDATRPSRTSGTHGSKRATSGDEIFGP